MKGVTVERIPIKSRASWLDDRRLDVTASEVAALYKEHKYLSALQLAYNKLYGEPAVQKRDTAKRRGVILEPACAAAIEHDHGLPTRKVMHYLRGRSASVPTLRIGATLDYDLEADGSRLLDALDTAKVPHAWDHLDGLPVSISVECKSLDRDIFEQEWSAGPPKQHIYQALVQAALGGYDGALIAALIVNYAHDLRIYTVARNPALEAKIAAAVAAFWTDMDANVLPEAEPRDNHIMAKFTRPVPNSVIDLRGDPAWPILLEERETWKAKEAAAKYEADAIEVRLKEVMGDHTIARVEGWRVSWAADKNGRRSLRIDRAG